MGHKQDLDVLVVDDDQTSAKALKHFLEQHFERVHVATNGADALHFYGTTKPALVFVDVILPDMSGVEVTRAMCAEDPLALVTIVTGVDDAEEKQVVIDSLKAGASEYLHKPVSEPGLRKIVYRLMGILNRRKSKTFFPDTLQKARFEFTLCSDTRAVPPTVQYLRNLLSGYIPDRDVMRLSLGLDEVLRNAFEHGNFGITSEEKKHSCDAGTFEQLLTARQQKAVESGKSVSVTISLDKDLLTCEVTDEGVGFDWRKAMASKVEPEHLSTDLHGRGVLAVNRIFDEVRYNDKGNKVTLLKRLVLSE